MYIAHSISHSHSYGREKRQHFFYFFLGGATHCLSMLRIRGGVKKIKLAISIGKSRALYRVDTQKNPKSGGNNGSNKDRGRGEAEKRKLLFFLLFFLLLVAQCRTFFFPPPAPPLFKKKVGCSGVGFIKEAKKLFLSFLSKNTYWHVFFAILATDI